MRFAHRQIKDNDTDLGINRTNRSDWAKSVEGMVRALSPLPISYDVDCTQEARFTEFSYTEFLGGILINAQNVEANCKIRQAACQMDARVDHLARLSAANKDKYVLDNVSAPPVADVGFMVGHNMFDLVSVEIISRLAFENRGFMIKLHPLTNMDYASKVASFVGWDRIIPPNVSGMQLLEQCDTAYVSTATELCALAVAKGKQIVNVSNFFNEAGGAYYSINTFLFRSEDPASTLNNLVDCPFSGIIFPWMDDAETRVKAFYAKAMEIRELHSPVSSQNRLKKIPC